MQCWRKRWERFANHDVTTPRIAPSFRSLQCQRAPRPPVLEVLRRAGCAGGPARRLPEDSLVHLRVCISKVISKTFAGGDNHTDKYEHNGPPLSLSQGWRAQDRYLRPGIPAASFWIRDSNNHWAATSHRQPCCPSSPAAGAPEIIAGLESPARPGRHSCAAESFIITDSQHRLRDWQSSRGQQQLSSGGQSIYCGLPTARMRPSLVAGQGLQADSAGISGFPARNPSRLHPFWLSIVALKNMSKPRVVVKQQGHSPCLLSQPSSPPVRAVLDNEQDGDDDGSSCSSPCPQPASQSHCNRQVE